MDAEQRNLNVLMLPWLAHGHISPFLELAKKLCLRNFHIYFCSTPVNLISIREKLRKERSVSVHLIELHLPSLPELPPHYHTTKGLPPHLMRTLKMAFDIASPTFLNILRTLKPDFLIYDFLQPWAPAMASAYDIPSVLFLSSGAAMNSLSIHCLEHSGVSFPYPSICTRDYEGGNFVRMFQSSANGLRDKDRFLQCLEQSRNLVLVKTFREIEAKYINYLSLLSKKKIVPVGPLVRDCIEEAEEESGNLIDWLDRKDLVSTVFVSFGTEYFLSKEDMKEVAHGLEHSNISFVWVVTFHAEDKVRVEEALPTGFLDRVGDRGIVEEGWVPQARILSHGSIGGFVSHCGWSSVMESMKCGVPIIAMPMHLDQPVNSKLVEEVGVGVEVKREDDGRLNGELVAKVIREVVVEKSGEGLRTKAKEMSEIMKQKDDEEINAVVDELMQLAKNKTLQFKDTLS